MCISFAHRSIAASLWFFLAAITVEELLTAAKLLQSIHDGQLCYEIFRAIDDGSA